jgi:hypothetical protein
VEIDELEALREAGTMHVFRGKFGGRSEGLRGVIEQVGAPADKNVVIVRSVDDTVRRNWDRRTMSIV